VGLVDWFIEDVLGIDIPEQQNPYGQGQDVTIHSTEAFLPIIPLWRLWVPLVTALMMTSKTT